MTIGLMTHGYVCTPPDPEPLTTVGPGIKKLHEIIRCRIEDVLLPLLGNCPIQHDNAPFDKPTDNSCWLRATILISNSRQADTGAKGRRYRTTGLVLFNIFTKLVKGDAEGNQISDIIVPVFRSTNDNGVIFKVPSQIKPARQSDSWMTNVKCPFFVDQIG